MRQRKSLAMSLFLTVTLALLFSTCAGTAEDSQPQVGQPQSDQPESSQPDAENAPAEANDKTAPISLIVSSAPVKCVGVGPDCLQVKYSAESDWEVLPGQVEGFEYEVGYRYVLLVEDLGSQADSAGSPKARYKLVEVQDKAKDSEVSPEDLGGTFWVLSSFGGLAQPDAASPNGQVSFQFDPQENRVSGRAGCNNYLASAVVDFALMSILIETVGTTRMACQEEVMAQEAQYLEMLGRVASYRVEAGVLYLFSDDGQVLTFSPGQPSR